MWARLISRTVKCFSIIVNSCLHIHDKSCSVSSFIINYCKNVPSSFLSILSLVQHGSDLSFSRVFIPDNPFILAGTALAVPLDCT